MTGNLTRIVIFEGENDRGILTLDRIQEIKPDGAGVAVTLVDQSIRAFDVPFDVVAQGIIQSISATDEIVKRQTDAAELQALLKARSALDQDIVVNDNAVINEQFGFTDEAKRKRWLHLSERIDQLTGYKKDTASD
ncbi:hypothetical protein [Nesterenkonia rhizosphaerae]|uniref:Uncharacterized protein n=1 Tax=Nesterenkonia rhizosphaerae TaxID=1348272 RepID=A0ABP9FZG1_9MICC